MQNILDDIINYLQLYSTKFSDYSIVIQANFKLCNGSATSRTGFLSLFFIIKNGKLSIICLF